MPQSGELLKKKERKNYDIKNFGSLFCLKNEWKLASPYKLKTTFVKNATKSYWRLQTLFFYPHQTSNILQAFKDIFCFRTNPYNTHAGSKPAADASAVDKR